MRILIVGNRECIHTVRWANNLCSFGWDIHFFNSSDDTVSVPPGVSARIRKLKLNLPGIEVHGIEEGLSRQARAQALARLIDRLSPDLIHSISVHGAGLLTLNAKGRIRSSFPKWIVSSLGSDVYLLARLSHFAPKVAAVLRSCDFYQAECTRDIALARAHGFKGRIIAIAPQTGGYLTSYFRRHWKGKPSSRKTILLKGQEGLTGRSLFGLRALERCTELLQGYELEVYSDAGPIAAALPRFIEKTGIPARVLPPSPIKITSSGTGAQGYRSHFRFPTGFRARFWRPCSWALFPFNPTPPV